jgi:hypothetical protein
VEAWFVLERSIMLAALCQHHQKVCDDDEILATPESAKGLVDLGRLPLHTQTTPTILCDNPLEVDSLSQLEGLAELD